ncbi:MAG: hypothetical protein HYX89_00470, partial [Chloroflexi bacterium]|nr:hypothetical protein [Chloroflexota bacterium]
MDEELLTERFFTEALEGDQYLWTSGFLNERFTDPLSPLGWSVIREPFEALAVRDPLRFLGHPQAETLPLTKLYRGLPFVNGMAFQIMYRLFPDSLLPEDAWRYFPGGDVSLRHQAPYPSSLWHPRVLFALARALIRDPGDWLPTHQYRRWESFVPRFEATMAKAKQAIATGLAFSETPHWVARVVEANRQLLQLHRWSLTYADLCYS